MKTFACTPRHLVVALTAALGLASAPLYAARTSVDAKGVHLMPQQRAAGYQVRVTGPQGFVFEQMFLDTESLTVQARDNHWADGSYSYEVVPVVGLKRRGEEDSGGNAVAAATAPALTESGSFRVQNGAVFVADSTRPEARTDSGSTGGSTNTTPPLPADNVIAEDLIVQGSACIGLDCVNNESFGFDTVRLKENNTRIAFVDTSTGAGFANTNWQLTANDSASGGLNKFSIEDITAATVPFTVVGAAPSNSIYVDSAGRVGFHTTTPVLDLHVTTGNTPAWRMEQTNASGFTAQTWDVASNEANFFVRDVTGGSRLPFRIRPGAPTSSIDIAATGNVGVGTAAPSARLHVAGVDGTTQAKVTETNATALGRDLMRLENNGPTRLRMRNTATGNEWSLNAHDSDFRINIAGQPVTAMTIYPNGNVTIAGTLSQSSDRNAKENFRAIDPKELLKKIAALDVTEWNFKSESADVHHIGPMAQDFHKLLGLGDRDDRIAPLDTSGVALAAIKGLQAEIAERDQRIAALEARLERLDKLTQQLARAQEQTDARSQPTAMTPASNPAPTASGL